MPGSSFRGSSREDSISSSLFGEEPFMNEDVPVVISRKATGDWDEAAGLGITNEEAILESRDLPKRLPPRLHHEETAPGRMETSHKVLIRQRSSEKIKAKRESMDKHRHECAESGDDEDEELGDTSVREKSPRSATKPHRGSKLGTEMMRTNSRGSVVSSSDINNLDTIEPPLTVVEELPPASEITSANLTPPELFSSPGSKVVEIDLNETPRPTPSYDPMEIDEEPTPRAPSAASTDYITIKATVTDEA
jgi:serine/threonine-protein kinase RIM15